MATKKQLRAEIGHLTEENKVPRQGERELLQATGRCGAKSPREIRNKTQTYLDIAGVILIELDEKGCVISLNKKGCATLGYEEGELTGRHWISTCIPEETRDEVFALWQNLIGGRIDLAEYHENPVLTKRGDRRTIAWHNAVLKDDGGKIVGILGSGEDITERKAAIEALQEYEKVVEGSQDLICVIDRRYRYVLANDTLLRYRNLSKPEVLGRPCAEIIGVDAFERRIKGMLDRCFEGKVEPQCVRRVTYPILGERDILVSHFPIEGAEGIDRAAAIVRDVTEQQRTQKMLEEREKLFREVVESTTEVFYVAKPDLSEMIYVSPAYESVWGWSCAGLYENPRSWMDNIHPEDRERVANAMAERISEGYSREYRIIRSDGSLRWIADRGFPVYDAQGRTERFVGTASDITERKNAEERLQQSHRQLSALTARLQSIREKERARVARTIHDELGQSLTCMKIDLSEVREESLSDVSDKRAIISKIDDILTFIDTTIDMVRRIASELRPSVLDDLGLVAAIEWQSSDFQKRTGITVQFKGPRNILLDKDCSTAIFRIFQESLTNVARHSKADRVEISLGKTRDKLVLTIRDNGKGIKKKAISSSISLGILGMRERISPFGGEVALSGRPGNGTTVTVRLPLPIRDQRNPEDAKQ